MTRPIALILMLLPPLSGCGGEPERPHFVPASADAPRVSTEERPKLDLEDRPTSIPKNIPMH